MRENGAVSRARVVLMARLSEIILGALLTASIAAFAFVLASQGKLDDRVRANEQETTRNTERIGATSAAFQKAETSMVRQFEELARRVDQRCDTLEQLLNVLVSARKNTEEDR